MGFRFQRRIKIMPGVTLNVGKRGVSTSIGRRGAHITFGQNGVRTTVGIPGTGISYTSLSKPSNAPEAGDVVAASFKVSVLRAWDAEALGSVSGVSSGAGAAAAGGCGALPGLRAGV